MNAKLFIIIALGMIIFGINESLCQNISIPLFPKDNIWNTPIDNLPIDQMSQTYINTIGADKSLHPDFGSGLWNGAPIGIPYVIVNGKQTKVKVNFDYADESDGNYYPIPENPPIEGGDNSDGDRHILIVDTKNALLYELYSCYKNNDGSWKAGSGAIFDLNSNKLRNDTWTSADAAGLPILPGLVRYDEIDKGEINHCIRFTVPQTQRKYQWPARHFASSLTDTKYPPMGLRMRLKQNYNINGFSHTNQIILKALKKYGIILADNGSALFISGTPDERWDNDDLNKLKSVKVSDFEAVDETSLMIDTNSAQAKQTTDVSNELKDVYDLEIYPIPTKDKLFVNYVSDGNKICNYIKISLMDCLGNRINNIMLEIENNEINDISKIIPGNISSGIYILQLDTGIEQYYKKIIIQ